jgi:hypothetical protein
MCVGGCSLTQQDSYWKGCGMAAMCSFHPDHTLSSSYPAASGGNHKHVVCLDARPPSLFKPLAYVPAACLPAEPPPSPHPHSLTVMHCCAGREVSDCCPPLPPKQCKHPCYIDIAQQEAQWAQCQEAFKSKEKPVNASQHFTPDSVNQLPAPLPLFKETPL